MSKGKNKKPQFPVKQQGNSFVDKVMADKAAREAINNELQEKIEHYNQLIADAEADWEKKQKELESEYQEKFE